MIAAKPGQSSVPEPSTRTTVASTRISRLESLKVAGSNTVIRSALPSGGHAPANTKIPRIDMSRVLPPSDATPDPGSLQVNFTGASKLNLLPARLSSICAPSMDTVAGRSTKYDRSVRLSAPSTRGCKFIGRGAFPTSGRMSFFLSPPRRAMK